MPPKSPIRLILFAASLMMVASCSKRADERAQEPESRALVTPDVASGPAISPTVAPGVAFNYSYAFRLPVTRIAAVQEEHAQACEKLGVTQCRITGLRYRVQGEDAIEAMLSFRLAPAIARQFGKTGVATVQRAEGMVVDTEISGTDVNTAIATAKRNGAEIAEQIATLEKELSQPGLRADRSAELQSRISDLRNSARETTASRDENEDALANTPMTFTYGSGAMVPGFDARSPIRDALQSAANILLTMLYVLIVGIALLAPITLAVGVLLYAQRKLLPFWIRLTRAPQQD